MKMPQWPWLVALIAAPLMAEAQESAADLTVAFSEGSPRDRFRIVNRSPCDLVLRELTIDLAGSGGALIFDTSAGGPGVQVFQPFELGTGGAGVVSASPTDDGDQALTLSLSGLTPGQTLEFTIDVDDTLPRSVFGQTQVSGGEIRGATIRASFVDALGRTLQASEHFGSDAEAVIRVADCAIS